MLMADKNPETTREKSSSNLVISLKAYGDQAILNSACDVCNFLLKNRNNLHHFMLSGRISRNIGENIFRSYTGTTGENTDFHVLVA